MSRRQEFLAQGTTNKAWYRDYVNPINPSGVMKSLLKVLFSGEPGGALLHLPLPQYPPGSCHPQSHCPMSHVISLSMMSMLRLFVIDLEDLSSSFLLEVAFSFVLLFGTPRGRTTTALALALAFAALLWCHARQLVRLGVSAPGTTTHAAPCYAMLP